MQEREFFTFFGWNRQDWSFEVHLHLRDVLLPIFLSRQVVLCAINVSNCADILRLEFVLLFCAAKFSFSISFWNDIRLEKNTHESRWCCMAWLSYQVTNFAPVRKCHSVKIIQARVFSLSTDKLQHDAFQWRTASARWYQEKLATKAFLDWFKCAKGKGCILVDQFWKIKRARATD